MSDPGQQSSTPEQRARQAEAQREVLLEALEIFTHDLSNPLQSLIVLFVIASDFLRYWTIRLPMMSRSQMGKVRDAG